MSKSAGDGRLTFDYSEHRVLGSTEDYTFAALGDVLLVIWQRRTTPAGVAALARAFDSFAGQTPGACLLTIVEQHAELPTNEARQALASFMKGHGSSIRLSAVAFEGTGFRAAAVRSVVTGLTMLARQPFPHKVFATVGEAIHWLFDMSREPPASRRPEELRRGVEGVRAERAPAVQAVG